MLETLEGPGMTRSASFSLPISWRSTPQLGTAALLTRNSYTVYRKILEVGQSTPPLRRFTRRTLIPVPLSESSS